MSLPRGAGAVGSALGAAACAAASAACAAASALALVQQLSSALMPVKVCSEVPKMTPPG